MGKSSPATGRGAGRSAQESSVAPPGGDTQLAYCFYFPIIPEVTALAAWLRDAARFAKSLLVSQWLAGVQRASGEVPSVPVRRYVAAEDSLCYLWVKSEQFDPTKPHA